MTDQEIKQWEKSAETVRGMFDLKGIAPSIHCPTCDAVPHIQGVQIGQHLSESTSGDGLSVHFRCEEGHNWHLHIADHSAGLWLFVTHH